jgi:hypothetical protein
MRTFWITTVVYVTVVIGIIAGAVAAFNAVVGMPAKGASNQLVTQVGPIQRTSGKWTPVEIKREPTTSVAPPLPPYVAPRLVATANAATAMRQPKIMDPRHKVLERKVVERKVTKQVFTARPSYHSQERQALAAFASPEPPRFFGPFRFPF